MTQKDSGGLPERQTNRAVRIARVGASYGFDFVLGRRRLIPGSRRRLSPEGIGRRMRQSFEELGPAFEELGNFLSGRGDLLPPQFTAELRAENPIVKPAPPSEIRRVLERELDNTLERSFVEFEDFPIRAGAFTQSHRAVLPGDRPALVVVTRPGVRREILAMRPVAELVKRRAGNRMPVDPVRLEGEFAAHVAHRRDMFSAAQTARKVADMEDAPLNVPQVYRDYSAGRCVTLEAPEGWSVPEPGNYREFAEGLVRLAVEHGVFLADPAPERFVVAGGEPWILDPTEAIAIDPERMRGVAEVLTAVRRGDIDAILRALPMAGGHVPRTAPALQRELREVLGSLGGPLWGERTLEAVRDRGLEALRKGGARLPVELDLLLGSLAEVEGMAGEGYTGLPAAAEAGERLISRYRDPAYLVSRTARRLARPGEYADYPRQIHAILDELKDGEVEVRFNHQGLDELISKVDILANRLVFALLISALILGSSLLGVFGEVGLRILGVNIFGLLGFLLAALLGLALLVGIVRSGRL